MVTAVTYDSGFDLVPGFPGLLYDAGVTDKISVPCGSAAVPFGCAVFADPATGHSATPVTGTFIGAAIHDHNLSGRYSSVAGANDTYIQYDAISVLRRGRIWARITGTVVKESVVVTALTTDLSFTTTAADATHIVVPNARFLSANLSIIGILAGDTANNIAILELHEPTI
jgi:hypothetical protein